MTLEESARKGYEELWVEMISIKDIDRKNELIGSLNFLQPLCGPGFLEWAMRHLPFYAKMQPEFRDLTLEEYFMKRQHQILQDLMRLLRRDES